MIQLLILELLRAAFFVLSGIFCALCVVNRGPARWTTASLSAITLWASYFVDDLANLWR